MSTYLLFLVTAEFVVGRGVEGRGENLCVVSIIWVKFLKRNKTVENSYQGVSTVG